MQAFWRTVPKAIIDSKVKVGINCEDNDWYGSGLSDRDEMNGPEAVAAHLSPFKSGAQATNSVSKFRIYLNILIVIKGLV